MHSWDNYLSQSENKHQFETFLILDESLFEVQSLWSRVFLGVVELLNLLSDLQIAGAGTCVGAGVPIVLKTDMRPEVK